MRFTGKAHFAPKQKDQLADMATNIRGRAIDSHSEYSVGVAVQFKIDKDDSNATSFKESKVSGLHFLDEEDKNGYYPVYTASNLFLSGMAVKEHAERLAMKQGLLDIQNLDDVSNASLKDVMIITSGEGIDVGCGTCLQTARSVCQFTDTIPGSVNWIGAEESSRDGIKYEYEVEQLSELLGETYAEV